MPLEDGAERSKLVADIFLMLISQRRDPNPDVFWGRARWVEFRDAQYSATAKVGDQDGTMVA